MQQTCLVPEECALCGEIFDLQYDIGDDGEEKAKMSKRTKVSLRDSHLCWKCRGN